MSPRDRFDRFMADVRNGTNFKIAPLSHAHYRAFFSAVLPIAAMSKIRGAFMVNGEPATPEHMRLIAPTLTLAECRSALDTFRAVGLLEADDELGGEWVHDFEEWNPEPKRDTTHADRQRRYRDRQKASRDDRKTVTRDASRDVTQTVTVTASDAREVEVEEEVPRNAPQGAGARVLRFDRKPVPEHRRQLAEQILVEFNQQAGTNLQPYTDDGKPSEGLRRIIGALTAHQAVDLPQAAAAIRWQLARPYWGDATPHPGNVFGPKVIDTALESSASSKPESSTSEFVARMNSRRATPSSGDAA